jgi:predicted amidophosphoribosyltransferase
MVRYFVETMRCPVCGESIALSDTPTRVRCPGCETQLSLRDRLCPHCGTYQSQPESACQRCGLSMRVRCPHCESDNWQGDDLCQICGTPLDTLSQITKRVSTSERLRTQMAAAQHVKAEADAAAEARMQRMLAEERAFREELQWRKAAQQEHERKMLTIVLVVSGILIFALLLYTLITVL